MLKLSAPMVRKMMEVDGSLKFFKMVLTESMSFMKSKITDDEFDKFIAEILEEVNIPNKMSSIYQQYYTAEDVLNLITFFKSSTGKKVIKVQNQVVPKLSINTQIIAAEMMVIALRKIAQINTEVLPPPKDEDESGEDEELT